MTAPNNDALDAEIQVGFQRLLGYDIVEWSQGHAMIELEIGELHLNRSHVLHGGVYATLLDACMGFSTVFTGNPEHKNLVVTLSMTTNFIKAIKQGKIRAIGTMTGGGKTIAFASGKIINAQGELLANATGTFKRVNF